MNDEQFKKLTPAQQSTVIKIAKEAERQGIKPELALAIASAETGGNFNHYGKDGVLTSGAGAKGVMQIMPNTAELFSKKYNIDINPDDEDSNIMGGVTILKDLLTQYKSPRKAVALYNASPQSVKKFLSTYDTDPDGAILSLPQQTQDYSGKVAQNFNLDDDKETGFLVPVSAEGSYEPEASRIKKEEAARPPKENGNEDNQGNLSVANAGLAGAGLGAIQGVLENKYNFPQKPLGDKNLPKLQEEYEQLLRNRGHLQEQLQTRGALSAQSITDLEDEFAKTNTTLDKLNAEIKVGEAEARRYGSSAVKPIAEVPTPKIITDLSEHIPNQTQADRINLGRIDETGTTGVARERGKNINTSIESKQTKANERVEATLRQRGVIASENPLLKMGHITTTPSGEVIIPRSVKTQTQAQAAEYFNQTAPQRFQAESTLERLNRELANQQSVGKDQSKRLTAARLEPQSIIRKGVEESQKLEQSIADKALLLSQAEAKTPGLLSRFGYAVGKLPYKVGQIASGAGTGMSAAEAINRFNAGDFTGGVINTIESAFAAMSMVPHPATRAVGTVGGLAMLPVSVGYDMLRPAPEYRSVTEEPQQ
jgi:uncharacterized coiled-coil protein SlyX